MTNKINGIDVSKYFIEVVDEGGSTINYKILPNFDRLLVEKIFEQNQQLTRLQEENEKIKKQYNCYACGNCNGKEDYINLEKHHKGLRKQFDELAKRNNTLSLRIEELEKENEKLKANKVRCAFKCLDNTFCDEAKIKIDKLELDKDCLNASLETARKYRGIAETDRDKYKQALEEIIDIAEKLITETPEYHSCYYKDECGDNCTPKKQSKVEYCCYENVDKILTIINEALNEQK